MRFNERLIELRKTKGWSQEELGERVDATRQTISKWELGQTTPEMDKLIELSKIFNISIDALTGNEEYRERNEEFSRRAFRIEYKSKTKLFGLPLVHINSGFGMYKAKGIIAIGTMASRSNIYWCIIDGDNKLGCVVIRSASVRYAGSRTYSGRCNCIGWYLIRCNSTRIFGNWRCSNRSLFDRWSCDSA